MSILTVTSIHEELRIQKLTVENDQTLTVENDQKLTVENDQHFPKFRGARKK